MANNAQYKSHIKTAMAIKVSSECVFTAQFLLGVVWWDVRGTVREFCCLADLRVVECAISYKKWCLVGRVYKFGFTVKFYANLQSKLFHFAKLHSHIFCNDKNFKVSTNTKYYYLQIIPNLQKVHCYLFKMLLLRKILLKCCKVKKIIQIRVQK